MNIKITNRIYHLLRTCSNWHILCLCELNLLFMHYSILYACHLESELDITTYFDNLLGVCFDIGIIYFICYTFFWRNSKLAASICFITTWLWSLSNVIYSRFFYHYLSLSAIEQGGVLTEKLIIRCIVDSLKISDIYYIVVATLFFFVVTKLQSINKKWAWRNITLILFISIITDISVHAAYCLFEPQYRYASYFMHRMYLKHIATHRTWSQQNLAHFIRGNIRTICGDLIINHQSTVVLSSDQVKQIIEEASKSQRNISGQVILTPKNIIFIIVESYMSFTSDLKVNGKEITPFLNSLKKRTNVYYNGNMKENVTIGESSDGQFIYMTGILPLQNDVTVSKVRRVAIPGLPKIIGRESRMIIPTTTSVWNQDEMCRQYGFDHLYTRDDYKSAIESDLNDKQVFDLAAQKDNASHTPFFSVILTMSMHGPYTEQIDQSFLLSSSSLSKELLCYLNSCHYTDHQIKLYFDHLIKSGLLDNSLIIISADHRVHKSDFAEINKHIPLYIINANGLPENMWQGECNQLDVFTTLLDLLGCQKKWFGLGLSLLSPNYEDSITDKTWNVSEWIINGDFFSKSNIYKPSLTKNEKE